MTSGDRPQEAPPRPDGRAATRADEGPEPNGRARSSLPSRVVLVTAMGLGSVVVVCALGFLYLIVAGGGLLPGLQTPLQGSGPAPTAFPTLSGTTNLRVTADATATSEAASASATTPAFRPGDPTATPPGGPISDPDYQSGLQSYKSGRYEEALALLTEAIEKQPRLAPAYRWRAGASAMLGDCYSGLADAEKAIELVPEYGDAWGVRGMLKGCLGDKGQELQDYQKALELDPSLAFVHHNLAVYYFQLGAFDRALEEYELEVAIDAGRSGGWDGKSEALRKLGRYQECVEAASRAMEINPEEWLAYTDRAYCEMQLMEYTAALDDYQRYQAHDPDDEVIAYAIGIAYDRRGEVHFNAGRYREAIEDLQRAVQLVPQEAHSYCLMANSYFELQEYEHVLEAGRASIDINRGCGAKLYEIMARSSYALEDYGQAIEYMNRALEQQQYPLGYYYRGIMYQAAGQDAEARKDLEYYLSFHPAGAEAEDAKARLGQ